MRREMGKILLSLVLAAGGFYVTTTDQPWLQTIRESAGKLGVGLLVAALVFTVLAVVFWRRTGEWVAGLAGLFYVDGVIVLIFLLVFLTPVFWTALALFAVVGLVELVLPGKNNFAF